MLPRLLLDNPDYIVGVRKVGREGDEKPVFEFLEYQRLAVIQGCDCLNLGLLGNRDFDYRTRILEHMEIERLRITDRSSRNSPFLLGERSGTALIHSPMPLSLSSAA